MKEKLNVSFKKDAKETGLASVGHSQRGMNIKINKKTMGYIGAPNWHKYGWDVRFTIMKDENHTDNNPNCKWKWVFITPLFNTEELAKQFVKDNIKEWNEKYKFYYSED